MPLSSVLITYDIADQVGVDFDPDRTMVRVTTDVVGGAVIDTDGNQIRIGDGLGTVGADGKGSVSVWVPGAGSNPATWKTFLHVDYVPRARGAQRETRTFGPYTITVTKDLADLVTEQLTIPTENAAVSATQAATSATAASTSAGQAATSATGAQTARTGAETARTGAETARTGAETAQTAAAGSATAAAGSATAAAGSATTASTAQAAVAALFSTAPELARNFVTNPGAEVDIAGWSGQVGATGVRVTSGPGIIAGVAALEATIPNANQAGIIRGVAGLTVGKRYTFSWWLTLISGDTASLAAYVRDGAGTQSATLLLPPRLQVGVPVRLSLSWTQTSTANANIYPAFRTAAVGASPAVLQIDGAMVTEGNDLPDYFDGSMPGCSWSGTAHNSISVKSLYDADDVIRSEKMPELARNLVRNPSMNLSNSAAWALLTGGASLVYGTTSAILDITTTRLVVTSDGTVPSVELGTSGAPSAGAPVTAGRTYNWSSYVIQTGARQLVMRIAWYDAAGALISTTDAPARSASSALYARFDVTGVAPTGAVNAHVRVLTLNAPTGEVLGVTGAALTETPTPIPYFDGYSPGCRWTGTPFASESVKVAPSLRETLVVAPEIARNIVTNGLTNDGIGWAENSGQAVAWVPNDGGYLRATKSGASTVLNVRQGSQQTSRVSDLVPGRTYTAYISGRASRAGVLQSFQFRFTDGTVGINPTATSQNVTMAADTWVTHKLTFVAPAGATQAQVWVVTTGDLVAGDTVDARELGVFEGTAPTYFDGDTPGCRWLGVPGGSASVKMLNGPDVAASLLWLDAGNARGQGSPEGSVPAPVGTRYVDTLATTGAVEWIKSSGSGTTGWRVAFGDTGWRDVGAAWLINGATVSSPLLARRVNDQVTVLVYGLNLRSQVAGSLPANHFIQLPEGFRFTGVKAPQGAALLKYGLPTPTTGMYTATNTWFTNPVPANTTDWDGLRGSLDWFTENAWPTVLPGNPA